MKQLFFQAIVGDQWTCKVIRGCKVWQQTELDPKDRLRWAHEVQVCCAYFMWKLQVYQYSNLNSCRLLPFPMRMSPCGVCNVL